MSVHTVIASGDLAIWKPFPVIVFSSRFQGLLSSCKGGAGFLVPREMGGLLRPKGLWIVEGMVLDFVLWVGRHFWFWIVSVRLQRR
jgi:hypothetical protein